jgi:hypothetical protein
MRKFYRQGARRILAGPKKMSTILITPREAAVWWFARKMLTENECPEMPTRHGLRRSWIVEKLRMEVDNVGETTIHLSADSPSRTD